MSGQISITGNLEKDQQILLFGLGGLIGLIILAMIIIVVIVIIRRARRSKAMPAVVPQVVMVEEKNYAAPMIEKTPVFSEEPKVEEPKPIHVVKEKEEEKPVQSAEKPKAEEIKTVEPVMESKLEPQKEEPKKEDKLEEIRRRLEEIRNQKKDSEPSVVLPKVEAVPIAEKIELEKPLEKVERKITDVKTEETILVEDTEEIAIPIHVNEESVETLEQVEMEETPASEQDIDQIPEAPEIKPRVVEDEGVMKEINLNKITDEVIIAESAANTERVEQLGNTHLPNGKFLPMKKMTFAEWVELFK